MFEKSFLNNVISEVGRKAVEMSKDLDKILIDSYVYFYSYCEMEDKRSISNVIDYFLCNILALKGTYYCDENIMYAFTEVKESILRYVDYIKLDCSIESLWNRKADINEHIGDITIEYCMQDIEIPFTIWAPMIAINTYYKDSPESMVNDLRKLFRISKNDEKRLNTSIPNVFSHLMIAAEKPKLIKVPEDMMPLISSDGYKGIGRFQEKVTNFLRGTRSFEDTCDTQEEINKVQKITDVISYVYWLRNPEALSGGNHVANISEIKTNEGIVNLFIQNGLQDRTDTSATDYLAKVAYYTEDIQNLTNGYDLLTYNVFKNIEALEGLNYNNVDFASYGTNVLYPYLCSAIHQTGKSDLQDLLHDIGEGVCIVDEDEFMYEYMARFNKELSKVKDVSSDMKRLVKFTKITSYPLTHKVAALDTLLYLAKVYEGVSYSELKNVVRYMWEFALFSGSDVLIKSEVCRLISYISHLEYNLEFAVKAYIGLHRGLGLRSDEWVCNVSISDTLREERHELLSDYSYASLTMLYLLNISIVASYEKDKMTPYKQECINQFILLNKMVSELPEYFYEVEE